MLEHGIPLEAIITELVLSGEVERTYRLLREAGYAAQFEYHSPTSQYGQLVAARPSTTHLDVAATMRELVDGIDVGRASPTSGTPSAMRATRSSSPCGPRPPDPMSRPSRPTSAPASARAPVPDA